MQLSYLKHDGAEGHEEEIVLKFDIGPDISEPVVDDLDAALKSLAKKLADRGSGYTGSFSIHEGPYVSRTIINTLTTPPSYETTTTLPLPESARRTFLDTLVAEFHKARS